MEISHASSWIFIVRSPDREDIEMFCDFLEEAGVPDFAGPLKDQDLDQTWVRTWGYEMKPDYWICWWRHHD